MIGNAHIDPVWIWDWREGLHEVLQTFRAALERLSEHPDLLFSASSAAQYEWVELTDPELFRRVREAVAEGRWLVTGGQWVEPDCALPSGESVCRQFLYGQRYFASRFGAPARVGYNIDSFGHAGSLPQLLAASGITSYVMMRPNDVEKPLPGRTFLWEGVDGSRLPTYRIPFDYSSTGDESTLIPERVATLLAEESSLPLMCFFGVGDHGGGPTRRALRLIDGLIEEHGPAAVGYSDPGRYFASLDGADLPVVSGELHWHAPGCYSAYHRAKQANARAERALLTAEITAECCRMATGTDLAAQPGLEEAWRAVLFNQFHDAIGGTCTEEAYASLDRMVDGAVAAADRLTTRATHTIVQHIDTWCAGAEDAEGIESIIAGMPVPLIVFNPLSWPVRGTAVIPHPLSYAEADAGYPTTVQLIASGEVTYTAQRALIEVEAPPAGWQLYWLRLGAPDTAGQPPGEHKAARSSADHVLTNGDLTIEIDPAHGTFGDGDWIGAGGVRLVVLEDPSDTWSHGVERYESPEQELEVVGCRLVEEGPLRATYRLDLRWGGSHISEEISLLRDRAFVEVRLAIDWHDPRHLLKLLIPAARPLRESVAGLPYGAVTRVGNGREEVMSRFVDLVGEDGALGITTDSLYGYDLLGETLRVTVLRSPRFADHGEEWAAGDDFAAYPATDVGRSTCSIRLHPHAGGWPQSRLAQLAEEHVTELPIVLDTWHRGTLPRRWSALEVTPGNVTVPVIKRAEAGGGSVLRLVETAGIESEARIVFGGREIAATLRPLEVATLFVSDDPDTTPVPVDVPELATGG